VIDSLGAPQTLFLLGGTSDIALAIARAYARHAPLRVVLAARHTSRRDEAVRSLQALGCAVEALDFDARATQTHADVVTAAARGGDLDISVVAYGVLGDPEQAWTDVPSGVELAEVNYVGPVATGIALGAQLREQGHGVVVALSSVAGERPRRSNFVYGSTKAGLDGFALGLGDALHGSGARVMVVRPGFVRTPMTAHLPAAPFAVDADEVAAAVVDGLARDAGIVYVPALLRPIFAVLRLLPRGVWRRLPI
jgi:decaprenylphospho-beta-D-erythro-pentofuranosid-2-ulose 2-reductase